jgi:glycine/sarcosine N-methyltransferase
MPDASSVADFYDQLALDYHRIYPDWDASMARQGRALDAVIHAELGMDHAAVLDCSCGIGTQAIALSQRGHRVTGSDISQVAVARAVREAALRGVSLPATVADMRRLPFRERQFDVVLSADNSLPHLLRPQDVAAALGAMRHVLRSGGLLILSTRPYDDILKTRPTSTPPQLASSSHGRTITFQLWAWHADGEHYDLEHFQLVGDERQWNVHVRRTTYWALTAKQLTQYAIDAGFTTLAWQTPDESGFFQPILTARAT